VRLTLVPAPAQGVMRVSMGVPMAQVDASGQFTMTGVTPGRYRITGAPAADGVRAGPGWTLLSAIAKGQTRWTSSSTSPRTTKSRTSCDVHGRHAGSERRLQDPSGRPAPDYTIVVFADDRQYWTTPSRRIGPRGRARTDGSSLANLPPGDYRIAAVVDVAPTEVNDPSFLEQLVAASGQVHAGGGEKKTQD
jgi:hypothetical protein